MISAIIPSIIVGKVISMHSDITKKDHEQSNHFPVLVVFYGPYTREEDYEGLKRTITPAIYLTIWTIGGNRR